MGVAILVLIRGNPEVLPLQADLFSLEPRHIALP